MKAMILAAGRGRRLAPLTDHTPKPMLPIGGQPLLAHQVRWLVAAGIRDIVVNLHHLGERIERGLGDGAALGARIRYSREPQLLDTGGGIRNALPHLVPGPFLVLNGDIWTDYPFERLTAARPNLAHLVLTPTPPHKARSDFRLDGGLVRRGGAADLTYCGIAVLHPALFRDAPDGAFSLAELFFAAAEQGALTGETFAGVWFDIGTPDQLRQARHLPMPRRLQRPPGR